MRVVLLVLLELVVSCSSVQITPIDVVNYNCQSNRRDIVKVLGMSMSSMITTINYITYYKVQSKKQFNILQLLISSITRIIIENYSFVGIFESRTFLKSVYFHQLMTTTSFGVANNDINNDHPTTSKEKLSTLMQISTKLLQPLQTQIQIHIVSIRFRIPLFVSMKLILHFHNYISQR